MSNHLPIVFAVYPLLLSGIAPIWLLRSRDRLSWATGVLLGGSIIVFAFLTGPWAFTSYYLRYVLLGLFIVIAVFSYWRIKGGAFGIAARGNRIKMLVAITVLLFVALDALALASLHPPDETLDVSFPLASGTYYVLQGGNSVVTNPFHALSGSKLALDIVKLNSLGNRAHGISPRALGAYEIFGHKLYSPCDGRILKIRDSLPDNPPGSPDTEHPEGNYIVLECAKLEILMGHLKRDSIRVAPGDAVTSGQPIAEVGNSGNTLEPHLHIGARKNGNEMGLRFNGRWLSANSVVTRPQVVP